MLSLIQYSNVGVNTRSQLLLSHWVVGALRSSRPRVKPALCKTSINLCKLYSIFIRCICFLYIITSNFNFKELELCLYQRATIEYIDIIKSKVVIDIDINYRIKTFLHIWSQFQTNLHL